MKRFKIALAAAALGLSTLTACGEQVKEVTDAAGDVTDKAGDVTGAVTDKAGDVTGAVTDKAGDVAGEVTDKVEGAKDKVGELTSLAGGIPAFTASATTTLDAVKSGNFDVAKEEVAKLQDSWGSISDQVKEKAPDVHTKIEEGIGSVTSGLEGDAPDSEQISSTITGMISSIKDAAL